MTYTSAQANKLLKKLNGEHAALLDKESRSKDFCAAMGEDIEIAFNNKYLTDVFKVLDDEEIYMDFNSNVSPCVVKPINGDEYYYLILPVRLFTGA